MADQPPSSKSYVGQAESNSARLNFIFPLSFCDKIQTLENEGPVRSFNCEDRFGAMRSTITLCRRNDMILMSVRGHNMCVMHEEYHVVIKNITDYEDNQGIPEDSNRCSKYDLEMFDWKTINELTLGNKLGNSIENLKSLKYPFASLKSPDKVRSTNVEVDFTPRRSGRVRQPKRKVDDLVESLLSRGTKTTKHNPEDTEGQFNVPDQSGPESEKLVHRFNEEIPNPQEQDFKSEHGINKDVPIPQDQGFKSELIDPIEPEFADDTKTSTKHGRGRSRKGEPKKTTLKAKQKPKVKPLKVNRQNVEEVKTDLPESELISENVGEAETKPTVDLPPIEDIVSYDKRMVACKYCNKTFAKGYLVYVHLSVQHPELNQDEIKTYKAELGTDECKYCGERKNSLHIERHEKRCAKLAHGHVKTKVAKTVQCKICHKMKANYYTLYAHVRDQHRSHPDSADYKKELYPMLKGTCEKCGKECMNMLIHRKDGCGDQTIPCELCSKMVSKKHIVDHMKRIHPDVYRHKSGKPIGVQKYICEHCSKEFKNSRNIQIHVDTVHRKIKKFKCNFCDRGFYSKGDMRVHVRYVHSTERPHLCNYCAKGFKTARDLKDHIYVVHEHKSDFSHFCPECKKGFHERKNMMNHLESFHYKIYKNQCVQCQRKCKSHKQLEDHKKVCPRVVSATLVPDKHKQGPSGKGDTGIPPQPTYIEYKTSMGEGTQTMQVPVMLESEGDAMREMYKGSTATYYTFPNLQSVLTLGEQAKLKSADQQHLAVLSNKPDGQELINYVNITGDAHTFVREQSIQNETPDVQHVQTVNTTIPHMGVQHEQEVKYMNNSKEGEPFIPYGVTGNTNDYTTTQQSIIYEEVQDRPITNPQSATPGFHDNTRQVIYPQSHSVPVSYPSLSTTTSQLYPAANKPVHTVTDPCLTSGTGTQISNVSNQQIGLPMPPSTCNPSTSFLSALNNVSPAYGPMTTRAVTQTLDETFNSAANV